MQKSYTLCKSCKSPTTCHMLRVRCHISGVRCQASGVRCQVSNIIIIKNFRTKWWGQSLEGVSSTELPNIIFFLHSKIVILNICQRRCISLGQVSPPISQHSMVPFDSVTSCWAQWEVWLQIGQNTRNLGKSPNHVYRGWLPCSTTIELFGVVRQRHGQVIFGTFVLIPKQKDITILSFLPTILCGRFFFCNSLEEKKNVLLKPYLY